MGSRILPTSHCRVQAVCAEIGRVGLGYPRGSFITSLRVSPVRPVSRLWRWSFTDGE
jgi:hypothetical protein